MIFKGTSQLIKEDIISLNFDAVIVASGFESRATYITEQVDPQAKSNFALAFDAHTDVLNRQSNDLYFKKKSFEIINAEGDKEDTIIRIINSIIDNHDKDTLNLLVDYSCMTRVWYAAILKYFWRHEIQKKNVNILFAYSPSKFVPPPREFTLNHFVEPLDGFSTLSIPDKPTALIIGLGYIATRAFGLTEYLDAVPFLFYNDNSFSNKYSSSIELINKELLNAVKAENIFTYPIRDMIFTESLLINLCNDLKDRFRIILAPCGPKPFTLISLITSLRIGDIDVWRISAGSNDIPIDKEHDNVSLFLNVHFNS